MCQFFLFLLRLHIALNANRDSDSPETEYVRKATINRAVVATMFSSSQTESDTTDSVRVWTEVMPQCRQIYAMIPCVLLSQTTNHWLQQCSHARLGQIRSVRLWRHQFGDETACVSCWGHWVDTGRYSPGLHLFSPHSKTESRNKVPVTFNSKEPDLLKFNECTYIVLLLLLLYTALFRFKQ